MNRKTAYKGWERPYPLLRSEATCTTLSGLSCILLSISGISLMALLPALSCSRHPFDTNPEWDDSPPPVVEQHSIAIDTKGTDETSISTLDVLIFSNDSLKKFETYQRFNKIDKKGVIIASTSGEKMLFACANSKIAPEKWMKVRTADGLEEFHLELEKEMRNEPMLSGACKLHAGQDHSTTIELERLTCEVVLQSLSCDFTGKPYEGERLMNAKAYLINVNTQSPVFGKTDSAPTGMINVGTLNPDDLSRFSEPELVMQKLPVPIGIERIQTGIRLVCCPNTGEEEGPGSPFTRLVIEGDIQGETYYWAVTVNRGRNGHGIERADRYIYDVLIKRKGSRDPDSPASIEDINLLYEDTAWEEKNPYSVSF